MLSCAGNATCKLIMVIPLISVSSAIYTMVALAVDRYRTVVLQKTLSRRNALYGVVAIWLWSFIVSAPQIYEYNIYLDIDDDNHTYKSCGSEGIVENFEAYYASAVVVIAYIIPFVALLVCYSRIVFYVWTHGRRLRRNASIMPSVSSTLAVPQQNNAERRDKMLSMRMIKIIKMLMSVTGVFLVLWTPYFVIFGINVRI